jgi:hypothetical protein
MDYQKGRVFHSQCFTAHGKDFAAPDSDLAQLSAKTRIELVQLKNMKVRSETQKQIPSPVEKKVEKKTVKKAKKKSKAKKSKPTRTKSKAKRTKSKAKKTKKKSKRRR